MHDLDWIEDVHHFAYQYLRGDTHEEQYVGTVMMGEEAFEEVLDDLGLVRNPFAYWKMTEDKRDSVGSWRMTHYTHPTRVEEGMQVHFTLFKSKFIAGGIDIYAHHEHDYSWSLLSAIYHVLERDFSSSRGVRIAREIIMDKSHVHLYDKRGGD